MYKFNSILKDHIEAYVKAFNNSNINFRVSLLKQLIRKGESSFLVQFLDKFPINLNKKIATRSP